MTLFRRFLPLLCSLLMMAGLSSCEHKELCYHHSHMVRLFLEFDWSTCAYPERPDGVCVIFYPDDPSLPTRRFDFIGLKGGEVTIAAGSYRMLCYNNDTSGIYFRGTDAHHTHEGFTRAGGLFEPIGVSYSPGSRVPRPAGTEKEDVVVCPDMMWGCSAIDVNVSEQGISYICIPERDKDPWLGLPPVVTDNTITLYPHELTCLYDYEIRNVKNISQITRMCASLSGMAPSLRFHDEELGADPVTLPFDAVSDGASRITGSFITFGHHPDLPAPHRMMLYVWTKDGKQYCYGTQSSAFDVTDQVHSCLLYTSPSPRD